MPFHIVGLSGRVHLEPVPLLLDHALGIWDLSIPSPYGPTLASRVDARPFSWSVFLRVVYSTCVSQSMVVCRGHVWSLDRCVRWLGVYMHIHDGPYLSIWYRARVGRRVGPARGRLVSSYASIP